MPTYEDKKGYKRHHSNLWSRKIAYHKIYLKNRKDYPNPFSEYEVHHIDGNKSNNHPNNLAILTPEKHIDAHLEKNENEAKYYWEIIKYALDREKQKMALLDFYESNLFNKKKFGEIVIKRRDIKKEIWRKLIDEFFTYINFLGDLYKDKGFSTPSGMENAEENFKSLKLILKKAIKRKVDSIYFLDNKKNIRERKKPLSEEQVERLEKLEKRLIETL